MSPSLIFTRGTEPAIDRAVIDAVEHFNSEARKLACRHVVDGAPVIFLCVQHSGGGLRCTSCMGRHLRRHDPIVERTCDRCGDTAADGSKAMHGITTVAFAAGVTVTDTRGRRTQLAQRVLLIGTGVCHRCYRALEAAA